MAFGIGNIAFAIIDEGYDLFHTVPFDMNFGGSIGMVTLMGDPIGPGNTDTIVKRIDDIPGLINVGDSGTTEIELVALSLKSVDPVDIGGINYDLQVIGGSGTDLNSDPIDELQAMGFNIPQDPGLMTIYLEDPNGGVFDAMLPVAANLIFTEVGNPGGPNDFTQYFSEVFPSVSPGSWSHTPAPNDQHNGKFPAGNFYAAVDPISGDPVVHSTGPHTVEPSTPEPSTILLLGAGIVGLFGVIYRQRRKEKKS
jgi:hypothetical protein